MTAQSTRTLPRLRRLVTGRAFVITVAVVAVLAVAYTLTGFFLGGLVPATLALLLAREAQRDRLASTGYLTGARPLRVGVALAWVGIVLAATAVVLGSIIGLLHFADSRSGADFGPNVN